MTRTVDAYLESLDKESHDAFSPIRDAVVRLAPGAVQDTSYGLAAFKYRGRPLLGFKASAKHLAIYPFSPAVIASVSNDLGEFPLAKGTIRFTSSHLLPVSVVERIISLRVAEIDAAIDS